MPCDLRAVRARNDTVSWPLLHRGGKPKLTNKRVMERHESPGRPARRLAGFWPQAPFKGEAQLNKVAWLGPQHPHHSSPLRFSTGKEEHTDPNHKAPRVSGDNASDAGLWRRDDLQVPGGDTVNPRARDLLATSSMRCFSSPSCFPWWNPQIEGPPGTHSTILASVTSFRALL